MNRNRIYTTILYKIVTINYGTNNVDDYRLYLRIQLQVKSV